MIDPARCLGRSSPPGTLSLRFEPTLAFDVSEADARSTFDNFTIVETTRVNAHERIQKKKSGSARTHSGVEMIMSISRLRQQDALRKCILTLFWQFMTVLRQPRRQPPGRD
jgi:hypothetical protein